MPLICLLAYGLLWLVLHWLHQGDHWLFALDDTATQIGFRLLDLTVDLMTVRSGPHVLCVLC